MKVLLADDSSSMRLILKSMLRKIDGVEIVEGRDGREALTLVESHTVQLVLLDLHMPVLDGLSVLAELRQRPTFTSLPVIIISSDADEAQIARAQQLGVNAYIKKPFHLEGLREVIARVLETSADNIMEKVAN